MWWWTEKTYIQPTTMLNTMLLKHFSCMNASNACLDTLSVCIRNATFLCDYHRYHFLDSLLIFYGILFVFFFLSSLLHPISSYYACAFQFSSCVTLHFSYVANSMCYSNTITINLSTSTPTKIHMKRIQATPITMCIDFYSNGMEKKRAKTNLNEFYTNERFNGI